MDRKQERFRALTLAAIAHRLLAVSAAVLTPFVAAGCAYAIMGGMAAKALGHDNNGSSNADRRPQVRAWGERVQLMPTNITISLPADSVSWSARSNVTDAGRHLTLLDGVAPDGGRATLTFFWYEDRNCGKFNEEMAD